jgi:DNA-binding transcriptional ArsR family regulator
MARPRKDAHLQTPNDDVCLDSVVHLDVVKRVRADAPQVELDSRIAGMFAALGDPTRLRIISVLGLNELCVCDLAAVIGLSESAISHQLRVLRAQGLVRSRREGRLVYYALDDTHVTDLYRQAHDHVLHMPQGNGT